MKRASSSWTSWVTQKYKLDDINEAMRDLRAGKNIRGVIAFG